MCARLGNRAFLVQRNDSIYLAPEWVAAPKWVDSVIGRDDHSDTFTMLYADSRGICRTYRMSLDADRWTMSTQPGPDFYQRFEGVFNDDRTMIDARWEASADGQHGTTDFNVTYRRLGRLTALPFTRLLRRPRLPPTPTSPALGPPDGLLSCVNFVAGLDLRQGGFVARQRALDTSLTLSLCGDEEHGHCDEDAVRADALGLLG